MLEVYHIYTLGVGTVLCLERAPWSTAKRLKVSGKCVPPPGFELDEAVRRLKRASLGVYSFGVSELPTRSPALTCKPTRNGTHQNISHDVAERDVSMRNPTQNVKMKEKKKQARARQNKTERPKHPPTSPPIWDQRSSLQPRR